ncbi:hypothetical protein [Carnimonas bestiolae]|uniref:hypothetical protein n=1 Tax=Carnimonas bestiolae TaxID=3402172 RepID=UPI003EDC110D
MRIYLCLITAIKNKRLRQKQRRHAQMVQHLPAWLKEDIGFTAENDEIVATPQDSVPASRPELRVVERQPNADSVKRCKRYRRRRWRRKMPRE